MKNRPEMYVMTFRGDFNFHGNSFAFSKCHSAAAS